MFQQSLQNINKDISFKETLLNNLRDADDTILLTDNRGRLEYGEQYKMALTTVRS